jgi:hypothetical protein
MSDKMLFQPNKQVRPQTKGLNLAGNNRPGCGAGDLSDPNPPKAIADSAQHYNAQ